MAFDRAVFARAATGVRRLEGATALSHADLPRVLDLNAIHLDAALGADEVEALAESEQAGLGHRRVVVEDEAHAAALSPELQARGWESESLLLLARDGTLEPPEAVALAEEVPYGHVRGLREAWLRGSDWADDALIEQITAADAREFAETPTRAFATFEQGRPLSYALLLTDGRDGMLEDVYTAPEARGRGLGTAAIAAVLHAARAARCELVFVPTEAAGGARALYERLGFEPVRLVTRFQKWVRP